MDTDEINKADNIECPRCLGKGYVDWADIRRLNKGYIWSVGSCAYCSGSGIVVPAKLIASDFTDSTIINETPNPPATIEAQQQMNKCTLQCFGELTLNELNELYEAEYELNGYD